jgi:hypothetical protein
MTISWTTAIDWDRNNDDSDPFGDVTRRVLQAS